MASLHKAMFRWTSSMQSLGIANILIPWNEVIPHIPHMSKSRSYYKCPQSPLGKLPKVIPIALPTSIMQAYIIIIASRDFSSCQDGALVSIAKLFGTIASALSELDML